MKKPYKLEMDLVELKQLLDFAANWCGYQIEHQPAPEALYYKKLWMKYYRMSENINKGGEKCLLKYQS